MYAITDLASRQALRPSRGLIPTPDREQLYFEDMGDGSTLLFVHGWAMNTEFWERQTADLVRQGHRCVAYDQRGCGRSSPAGGGYDLDGLADDLAAVIEHLELDRVTLVAHSMGACQVARYLSRHGGARIAGAILVAGTTPCLFPDPASRTEPLAAQVTAMMADRPAYVAAMAEPFFAPEQVSPHMVAWSTGLVLRATLHAAIEQARTNINADVRADMAAFTCPTLIVHGSADQSCPLEQSAELAHAMIPGSELLVYEGASHALPLTRGERLTADIAAFVRRTDA
jgi:pimeloyl-ACP methyl ester carboxylesterase